MIDRTEEEKDVLREIGNIGGGNALTSLSVMLDQALDLEVPVCTVVNREDAGNMLQNPDSLYAGISMTMSGTVECMLVLLMNKQFTKMVIDTIDFDESEFDVASLTEMQKSALCEVGNIMGNSYVTAIGSLLDLQIEVSVPQIVVDSGRSVLEEFLAGHASKLDRLLFVNSSFKTKDQSLESCMLMCPTDESLAAMLEKLGF